MSDVTPTAALDGLAALRQAHLALLTRLEEATGDDANARQEREALRALQPEVQQLVDQGAKAGALIEDPRERSDAQVLLDYWRSALGHAGVLMPSTRLEAFDPSRLPELPDDRCPYVGLEPFREAQSAHFRGRDADAHQLVQRLHQQPLQVVLGASGSGKSSLVLAGVLPLLRGETRAQGGPAWTVLPETLPGDAMWRPLLDGLGNPPGGDGDGDAAALLLQRLDALEAPAIVTIDQFEEVFTLSGVAQRDALMRTLAALLASPRGHRLLLTVREEFRAQVSGLQALSPWLLAAAWYQINPMSYEALKAAVEEPARSVGLQFQPGVADDLVKRVLGQPAALPLLQYALGRLWAMRDRNRITHEVYARLGDPLQALMRSADEFYAPLAPQTQQEVRRVLLALVRIDDRLDVYRQPRLRQELLAEGNAQTADAIDRLLRQGYVRRSRGPSEADERLSICHEALVRNWPRLVDWIDEERRSRQQRLAFSMAAARWHADGRPAQGLLTAWQIDGVRAQADRLSGVERDFFDASVHALEAAQNEQLRQAKAEADRAQRLAEEERQRAAVAEQQTRVAQQLAATEERQGRRARFQRNVVLIATPLLIAATVYFAWRQIQLDRSEQQLQAARLQARLDQQILAQRPEDQAAQTDRRFAAELSRDLYGPVANPTAPDSALPPTPDKPEKPEKPEKPAPAPAAAEPPRVTVYLHIGSAAQRPRAQLLAAELRQGGLDVPRIVLVPPNKVPSRSDVRYFHVEDAATAARIAAALRSNLSASAETQPKSMTSRGDQVPQGHIELWFALDALLPAGAAAAPNPPAPDSSAGPASAAQPGTKPPAQTAPGTGSSSAATPAPGPVPVKAALPEPSPPSAPTSAPVSRAVADSSAHPPANPYSAEQRVQLLIHRLEHHGQRATTLEGLNTSHRIRLQSAKDWARHLNIRTPLGLAVLYDTEVGLRGKLLYDQVRPVGAGGRAAEKPWLLRFLELRANPADNPKAQDPQEQQRMAELRQLIHADQWDLGGEWPAKP